MLFFSFFYTAKFAEVLQGPLPASLPPPPKKKQNKIEIIISGHKSNITKPSLAFLAVGHA